MKFTFVILHYKGYRDTYDCVLSILNNIFYKNLDIVIVDNYSGNGSLEKLESEFCNIQNVHFVKSDANLGFAKGNNLGYNYAKDLLNPDFIIMINNDTLINQKDFLEKIITIHIKTGFNILGPDILSTKDNKHQNPQRINGIDYIELKRSISNLKLLLYLSYLNLDNVFINFKNYLLKLMKRKKVSRYNDNINFEKELYNVQLHGACFVFDKFYINKYNGLYSKTFMYAEEDILFYIAKQENLNVLYSPEIQILHKEGSSTNIIAKTSSSKRIFNYKNSLNSLKELKKIFNNKKIYTKDLYQ